VLGWPPVVSDPADLCLSLHGPTAACHEQHAAPGSFAAAVGALGRARAERRRTVVATWITRSTCRQLVALVDLLAGLGVAGWCLSWPRVRMPEGAAVARTVPRLGIAVPHALRAVERAVGRGLSVAVVGVPSCALGPFAALGLAVGPAGVFPRPCEGCAARAGCAGIDAWYLARFGAHELHPVAAVPRARRAEGMAQALASAVAELGAIA
jgi:hypothetical protein